MKAKKTSKKSTNMSYRSHKHGFLDKFLTVLLTISMVTMQVPVPVGAVDGDPASDGAPAQTQTAEVEVGLNLQGAYLTYGSPAQKVAAPTTKLNIPASSDFKFDVAADNGYTLQEVAITVAGTKTVLQPQSDGSYLISASQVASGLTISATATKDPDQQEASVESLAGNDEGEQQEQAAAKAAPASVNEEDQQGQAEPASQPELDIELQFTDYQGNATDVATSKNIYAYVEGPNWSSRITAQLAPQGNGLYKAVVTGLLDGNGNKQNNGQGDYYPVNASGSYKVTLFTKDSANEGSRFDQNNDTAIANDSVLEGQYVVSVPSDNATTAAPWRATAQGMGPAGSDTYQSILGEAINFGIVAEDFTLDGGDAESNVAALRARCTSQTGNDKTNHVEQTYYLGQIDGSFNIKGNGAYVYTPESEASKVVQKGAEYLTVDTSMTQDQVNAKVNGMLDAAKAQSAALAGKTGNAAVSQPNKFANKYVVDLTGRGAGTYYVTVDDALYQKIMGGDDNLNIIKSDDQTIVFNVTGNPSSMRKFSINGHGADQYLDSNAGATTETVVWNFANATGNILVGGSVTGTILAPNASVKIDATSSGWLIAKQVQIGSGEWHSVYQHVEKLSHGSSVTLGARKTIDGQDATVNGFTFELAEQSGDGWNVLGTTENSGANIAFDVINYDEKSFAPDEANGTTQTHVYRIRETQGVQASDGSTYQPDQNAYYAKVTVTKSVVTQNGTQTTSIQASAPAYYSDAACTQALAGAPTFDNKKQDSYEATGTLQLHGTKAMTGRALTANDHYTFSVKEGDTVVATGESQADGTIAFTPITYTLGKGESQDHSYTVSEDGAGTTTAGVTNDSTTYQLSVHVSDNGDGTAKVEVTSGAPNDLKFTNTYAATGSITLTGTKAMSGRALTEADAGRYTFSVREGGQVVSTGTNAADGSIAFTPIEYTSAGEHTYTISEDGAGTIANGVTNTSETRTVKVNVSDDGQGHLDAAVEQGSDPIAFTNTYAAQGLIAFSGHKTLDGAKLQAGQFSFQLKDGDGNVLQTVTNGADGSISFAPISYTLADVGDHAYTVSEVKGSDTGVTYDATTYQVTVHVADNGDGTLAVTSSIPADKMDFTNSYQRSANGTAHLSVRKALSTGASPQAGAYTFELRDAQGNVLDTTSNDADGLVSFKDISYTLDDLAGAKSKTFTYTVHETSEPATGWTNAPDATITVNVADVGSGQLAVTYGAGDQASPILTSPVMTNTYAAQGSAQLEGTKALSGRAFRAAAAGTLSDPTVATWDADSFSFQLERLTPDAPMPTSSIATAQASEGAQTASFSFGEIHYTLNDLKNADGTYAASKAFTYQISEVVPADADKTPGITYTDATQTATVTVTDNGNGTLSTSVAYGTPQGAAFTNAYAATGSTIVAGTKTVEGRSFEKGDSIAFTIAGTDDQGNQAPLPTDAQGQTASTVTVNPEQGTTVPVTFGEIHYTLDALKNVDGTYARSRTFTYTVSEHATMAGVAADQPAQTFTVTVSDNGNGTLKVVKSASMEAQGSEGVFAFTNTYAASGSIVLTGTKSVENATGELATYDFVVNDDQDDQGNPVATGKNDADGKINFSAITYKDLSSVGEHSYTVKEVVPKDATKNDDGTYTKDGITYDTAERHVTVDVTDKGDGTLSATIDEAKSDKLSFTNRAAKACGVTVKGTKVLTGRQLKSGEFSFGLFESADATEPIVTATNAADGSFQLATASDRFTQEGTYHYVVREIVPADGQQLGGVTYDAADHPVTITVTDDHQGQLYATATFGKEDGATFTNAYNAEGTAQVQAQKQLISGGQAQPLTEGEFSFTLKNAKGDAVSQAYNKADGTVSFAPITYTTADMVDDQGQQVSEKDFAYTVSEDIPSGAVLNNDGTYTKDGITYDGHEAQVTVHVTDQGDGKLATEVSYDEGASATFTNTSFSAQAAITASKHYYGLNANPSFTYVLTAANDQGGARSQSGAAAEYAAGSQIVDEGQQFSVQATTGAFSGGDAEVAFPTITYHKAGTYYYTLAERQDGTDANDASTYLVKVTVDAKQGVTVQKQLMGVDAEPSADCSADFYNNANIRLGMSALAMSARAEKTQKVSVVPEVKKELQGGTMHANEFEFQLIDASGSVIATATNAADGSVRFSNVTAGADGAENVLADGLSFTKEGSYSYKIVERQGSDQTIDYDQKAIDMTVKVTQKDGHLQAQVTYSQDGVETDSPTFTNSVKTVSVRVQKRSRDYPYEPLEGARYGLWMVGSDGADIYLGNQTSGKDGYMTFDVPLTEGEAYYFKEESAPEGHLVDPYRSTYFTVTSENGDFELVYEDDPRFQGLVDQD